MDKCKHMLPCGWCDLKNSECSLNVIKDPSNLPYMEGTCSTCQRGIPDDNINKVMCLITHELNDSTHYCDVER